MSESIVSQSHTSPCLLQAIASSRHIDAEPFDTIRSTFACHFSRTEIAQTL